MAGHKYNIAMPTYLSIAGITRTLFQIITPATRKCWISELHISGRSVSASDIPYIAKLVKQTSAGTAGTSITPAPIPDVPASLLTVNSGFSAEPTDGAVIQRGPWLISPVGTLFDFQMPDGEEIEMQVSSRLGLIIVAPQAVEVVAACVIQE